VTHDPGHQHSSETARSHDRAILRLLERPVTDADLAAGAAWAARPAIVHEGVTIGLLLFRLGDETAALPAKLLRRVTPWARPTPIPHRTTSVMRGVCNIRGELILCADLHRLLGLPNRRTSGARPADASDARRMVVIGPRDAPWVFEVDRLVGIERVAAAQIHAPPVTVEHAMPAYTTGISGIGGEQVTVLDGERVLAGFQAGLA
jgi:chemotaxis signal transduction protein